MPSSNDDPTQAVSWLASDISMPNYIAPGPKQGPQNGLSIQHATCCASRFPNWKMGSTLQGLL